MEQDAVAQFEKLTARDFVRWLGLLVEAQGEPLLAAAKFAELYPRSPHLAIVQRSARDYHVKAPVAAGSTLPAVTPELFGRAFLRSVMNFTIIGRLPLLRRAPFKVPVTTNTTPAPLNWFSDAKPAPATKHVVANNTLTRLKAGGIIALTREYLRLQTPAAFDYVKTELGDSLIAFHDAAFVDPSATANVGLNPASITSGLTPISSTGSPASDVRLLMQAYLDAGGRLETACFVLSSANAMALRLTGNSAFEGLDNLGGQLSGAPAIASQAAGNQLILVDQSKVIVADDGGIDFSVSEQASVEMLDSSLVQDGTAGTGAALVSLWQNGLVGVRIEREINWATRTGHAAVVDGFDYVNVGSPA